MHKHRNVRSVSLQRRAVNINVYLNMLFHSLKAILTSYFGKMVHFHILVTFCRSH